MTYRLTVPGTHVHQLTDAVLADRLARDILRSVDHNTRALRVAGYDLIGFSPAERAELAWPLRHRKHSTVVRHTDGSIDVHLITGLDVHVLPKAGVR